MSADTEPEFEFIQRSGGFEDYILDYAFRDDRIKHSVNDFLNHVFDNTVAFIEKRLDRLRNIKFSLSLSRQFVKFGMEVAEGFTQGCRRPARPARSACQAGHLARYFNKLRLRGRKQVIYNTSKIVTVISITR